jgi:hypothetical protein
MEKINMPFLRDRGSPAEYGVARLSYAIEKCWPPERGIRIITPYSEHICSADPAAPQQLLDNEALRQQNAEGWRRFRMVMARRQQKEIDGE